MEAICYSLRRDFGTRLSADKAYDRIHRSHVYLVPAQTILPMMHSCNLTDRQAGLELQSLPADQSGSSSQGEVEKRSSLIFGRELR